MHVYVRLFSADQRGPVVQASGEYVDGAASLSLGVPPPSDVVPSAAGAGVGAFPCASAASESSTLPTSVDRMTPSDTAELSS